MREALSAQSRGDVDSAHSILQSTLHSLPIDDSDGRSSLIAFDADLLADAGRSAEALDLYREALSLSGADAYRKYSIELSLGGLCERTARVAEAREWYTAAIRTSLADDAISAGSALMRLVALANGNLTDVERTLSEKAVRHYWQVLRLAGQPEASDLGQLAKRLVEAAGIAR
jgi:tetratricopeptide (TPR) repeat protein